MQSTTGITGTPRTTSADFSLEQQLLPRTSRPPQEPEPHQKQKQHNVAFRQELCLLGRFSVEISSNSASPDKAYAAHVFDKGTLFTYDAAVGMLAALDERSASGAVCVSAFFTRNNRSRVAHDKVNIDLGRGSDCFSVSKPGTALDVLFLVDRGAQFFLQATAISHLMEFVSKRSATPWLRRARLVSDIGACGAGWQRSDDFKRLLRLCKVASNDFDRAPVLPAASYNRVPAPQTLGRVTVHASDRAVIVPTAVAAAAARDRQPFGERVPPLPPLPPPPPTVDAQYPALSKEQSLICTSCIYCTRRFRFATELFFHFVMIKHCRDQLLGAASAGARGLAGNKHYEALCASVAERFGGGDLRLACSACDDVGLPGPLEYCMHRDGHLPAVATFIACQGRMAEPFPSCLI